MRLTRKLVYRVCMQDLCMITSAVLFTTIMAAMCAKQHDVLNETTRRCHRALAFSRLATVISAHKSADAIDSSANSINVELQHFAAQ